jgi:hypothetical protein
MRRAIEAGIRDKVKVASTYLAVNTFEMRMYIPLGR